MTLKKPEIWNAGLSRSGGLEWSCGGSDAKIDPQIAKYTFGCQGKVQYLTFDAAGRTASSRSKTSGERFVSYHCQFCRRWHVGGDR